MSARPQAATARARRLRAALIVLLATSGGLHAESTDTSGALAGLMQALSAHPHRRASFTERDEVAVLTRPLQSSGELYFDAPDRLEKRTLQPKRETLVLEQGRLEMRRGERHYALALGDAPILAPLVDSIRATLAGDLPALERLYRIDFEPRGDDWTLDLVPRDAQLAARVRLIRIAGRRDELRSVEIRRGDGDRSLMTIHDLDG